MIELAIKLHLQSNGITETIYLGFLPPSPNTAIKLTITPGLPPDAKHNYDSIGLQVLTRAPTYLESRSLINTVFDKLQSFATATVSGYYIVDTQAQQDPFFLGLDEQDRYQWAQNFIIDYYNDLGYRR